MLVALVVLVRSVYMIKHYSSYCNCSGCTVVVILVEVNGRMFYYMTSNRCSTTSGITSCKIKCVQPVSDSLLVYPPFQLELQYNTPDLLFQK